MKNNKEKSKIIFVSLAIIILACAILAGATLIYFRHEEKKAVAISTPETIIINSDEFEITQDGNTMVTIIVSEDDAIKTAIKYFKKIFDLNVSSDDLEIKASDSFAGAWRIYNQEVSCVVNGTSGRIISVSWPKYSFLKTGAPDSLETYKRFSREVAERELADGREITDVYLDYVGTEYQGFNGDEKGLVYVAWCNVIMDEGECYKFFLRGQEPELVSLAVYTDKEAVAWMSPFENEDMHFGPEAISAEQAVAEANRIATGIFGMDITDFDLAVRPVRQWEDQRETWQITGLRFECMVDADTGTTTLFKMNYDPFVVLGGRQAGSENIQRATEIANRVLEDGKEIKEITFNGANYISMAGEGYCDCGITNLYKVILSDGQRYTLGFLGDDSLLSTYASYAYENDSLVAPSLLDN